MDLVSHHKNKTKQNKLERQLHPEGTPSQALSQHCLVSLGVGLEPLLCKAACRVLSAELEPKE